MSRLKNVIRFELKTETYEKVIKSKLKSYAKGGFSLTETIIKETTQTPAALLDCGHWRLQDSGTKISESKRLACFVCEINETQNRLSKANQ